MQRKISKIKNYFKKPKQQDKNAEREFFNRQAKNRLRSDKEPLYAIKHRQNTLQRTVLFVSKIIEKENLHNIKNIEVGSSGGFSRTFKNIHPNIDISLTIGDIALMQLMNSDIPSLKVNLDIEYLPFRDDTFDFIYLRGVLHHFPDLDVCSKELMRVCKKSIIATDEPCGTNPLAVFSRIMSRFLSHFVEIDTTVNETMHTMGSYKLHFYKHGAKSVVVDNGDEIVTNDQNWVSCLSNMKKTHRGFLHRLLLLRCYLQRILSLYFSKYSFSWNTYIIFVTCSSSIDTKIEEVDRNERKNI